MSTPHFKRVLLKLSGEALASRSGAGIDPSVVKSLATEIREVHDLGVEIAVVLGGGNIFRGSEEGWMERASADSCGMLATVINGLVLQDALERAGVYTRVLSAIELRQLAEPYIRRRAIRHMEKKRIVIFTAGTGNPYFTTDTAAALRATEIGAEIILKGTKVDGVYNTDPMKNRKARMFSQLSYLECLKRDLKVMDATSISLCRDNKIPIIVFNLFQRGNMKKVVCGSKLGTRVS